MALSCPCCEFGVVSSEDLVVEARPLRTLVWGTRYPLVTWRTMGPQPLGFLTEQRGAVLLVPAGNVTRPGPYRLLASAWNLRPYVDVFYALTRELFESRGLWEQSNLPPIKGRCLLTPERGFAVRTIFQLECTDFVDPDGEALSYGFYFCTHGTDQLRRFEGGRPSPWHSCTLMKSSLDDGNFTGVLPVGGNTTEPVNCSVLVFVNDNVGQYVYDVLPVLVEIGSCSDIKLETAEDYARKTHQNGTDAILSFIKSSSMLIKSKFYKDCEQNGTTAADADREADVLEGYVEYLKDTTVTTEDQLHSSVSVLTTLVPENVSVAKENFTKAVIDLMNDYASTFDNLTAEEGQGRIADLTAFIGGELIEGLTSVLDLKAPTPPKQPVEVPTNYEAESSCITVERLVHNLARVAAGVARVVDTEEEDVNFNVKDYEVWIRESKRRGFLGTSDGTRVRVDIATEGQTAIVFPSSPFRCHATSKLTNTQAVSIQTTQHIADTLVSVGVPIEGYLKRQAPIDFKGHTETYETSFSNVSIHSINVTEAGVYLKLDFIPTHGDRRLITAVAAGRPPTRSDFLQQNRFHLSSNVSHENRIEFVPTPTVVMVAVLPLTYDAKSALEDPYRRRGKDGGNMTYKLRSTLYSCLFWNSTQQAYSSSGCRVLMDSDDQFVHCTCQHNSIFAGGLFIAPHPINFTDLGFLLRTMSSNLVMAIILFCVWTIYLSVMVWAIKQDLRDEGAAGIEYLAENEQDDSFGYLVSVYTWFLKGSGTTSRVLLKIHGSDDESREVVLRDGARNPLALQAGGRDWYFLSHPSSLGDIEAISLTLDLKGKESSWNLNTVVVRDLQTASRTVFVIDDVLTPDAYKGTSTFTFEAADESLLRNPWRIFSSRMIRYFREEHLIFSIFSRLPTSNFTRKQRASVALLLVTTGMMVSLMFYGLDPDEEEFFNMTFLYTLFELPTRREVVIAVQSTLLVTPFAFLVVFLFERSRPPAFRRKPAVPKVYVEDAVEDVVQGWVHDTASSAESSKTGNVPKELLTSNAQANPFPSWVSVFAWFLCLSASLVASVFIILYGLTYGYHRSLSWVRCNLVNVVFSEFVISPLKILCLSAVMACVLRAPIEMEHIPVRFIE
ncbi:hypothetical protein V5799_002705 [Amblyomma americanum]|uniref:PLAT domain-containing protein n=1 Tax=Amblyomma americanum TaxID=6943 RepID=A0AAQ4DB22_AMBAM